MIKSILIGVWVCAATMIAAYLGASWQKPAVAATEKPEHSPHSKDLTLVRTRMISVPVVADGAIRGYVVAQFAFTASASHMKHMSVKPDLYVLDEAFQLIFSGEMIDFRHFKKQDLPALGRKIVENVNKRLGARVIEDVLVQELNYVPKDKIRGGMK
jgi:hypothetical protein